MATVPELEAALVKADAAGDVDAAKAFAAELRRLGRRQTATSQLDRDRELLRTEAGRAELEARAAEGEPNARGNIGLLADIGLEGGAATGGQMMGSMLGPVGTVVGGGVGGALGNLASQKRRILAGEQPGYRFGEVFGSALTGAIPGAPLASSSLKRLALEGIKQGGAGVIAKTAETLLDEGRLPSGTELAVTSAVPAVGGVAAQRMQTTNPSVVAAVADATTKGATERATLKAAREAGYKVLPSDTRPGMITDSLSSFGGKAALAQEFTLQNQEVTNKLAKRILGLPPGPDITPTVLENIRKDAAKPYAEIEEFAAKAADQLTDVKRATTGMSAHETAFLQAEPTTAEKMRSLSTQAAADVRNWRDALQKRNLYYEDYRTNKTVASLEAARANEALAEDLSNKIILAAEEIGNPKLAKELSEARTRIAQTHDIERALNDANADIIATELGKAARRGAPLTGDLKTIADFDRAFGQRITKEAAKVPAPGVSALNPLGALIGAAVGFQTMGPYGAALGAYPLLRGPARSALASDRYQKYATNIPLSVDAKPPVGPLATRAVTQEAAQEVAEELKPETKAEEPERKVVKAEEEIPTLTPEEFKKFKSGKFRTVNGTLYEKLPDGTKRKL